ncbi:MAG: hypothetical protein B6I24_08995 [Bacteroidetes bacterium 4572_128]|nr:MAG: hypothetical protein B6I24_08995 [Bacteroidetes bacterium 4572_128]
MKTFKKYLKKNTNFSQFYYEKNPTTKRLDSQNFFSKNAKILIFLNNLKKIFFKKRLNFNIFK